MSYYDKYGRLHHKLCKNGEPAGNNGWIYSAYADKAGLSLDQRKLEECFKQCLDDKGRFVLRSPLKGLPPMSRDEILGVAQLGLLKEHHLDGWSFSPRPIPPFNPIKLVQQLLEVRGKHRNYFWENNLDQLYRFAFSVPLTDRDFILDNTDKEVNVFASLFYSLVATIDKLTGGESGIRWLKYGKSKEAMKTEFPEDHPLQLI